MVDVDSGKLVANPVIRIDKGVIVEVAARKPGQAVDHDLGDVTLVPGLADMHVHSGTSLEMQVLLANGITTVLNMGGASTAFLVEKHLPLPMDFSSIPPSVSRMGTGTMVVLDDRTCPVGFMANLERFFTQESCGWCTPCR